MFSLFCLGVGFAAGCYWMPIKRLVTRVEKKAAKALDEVLKDE